MEKIIKKAIEGGYRGIDDLSGTWHGIETHIIHRFYPLATLDPLFWQALGKVCGWKYGVPFVGQEITVNEWLSHALRFHEINLTEGWEPAVSYLTNLIEQ